MGGKESVRKRTSRKEAFAHAERYKEKDRGPKYKDGNGVRMHANRAGKLCGAKKKNGDKCTMAAGWGTPHPGMGACKWHGGCVPSHVASAAQDQAQTEYRQLLGTEREMNPFEAIMWCIKIRAGEVEWLSKKMSELEEKAWIEETLVGKQFHLFARERTGAMHDLVKFSQIAIQMGIAERYVRLAEVYGQTIAKLIEGILGDLNLSDEQRAMAPKVVHRNLLLIEGNTDVSEEIPLVIEAQASEAA